MRVVPVCVVGVWCVTCVCVMCVVPVYTCCACVVCGVCAFGEFLRALAMTMHGLYVCMLHVRVTVLCAQHNIDHQHNHHKGIDHHHDSPLPSRST